MHWRILSCSRVALPIPHRAYSRSLSRAWLSTTATHRDEEVKVRVGGNGHVNLTISYPRILRPTSPASISRNILVHFRPGPYPEKVPIPDASQAIEELKRSLPSTTIIDVNYRLARRTETEPLQEDHRFPTPVHDVHASFETILELREAFQTALREVVKKENPQGPLPQQPKICLYGTHIGASLAMTLALTSPNHIHAVCIQDPLVDWVVLEDFADYADKDLVRRSAKRHEMLRIRAGGAEALIGLRKELFHSHSGYFDPFASPVLFLRAPARDTPTGRGMMLEDVTDISTTAFSKDTDVVRNGDEDEELGFVDDIRSGQTFGPYDDDWHNSTPRLEGDSTVISRSKSSPSTIQDPSILPTPPQSPSFVEQPPRRRRKVLRKWPANVQPETVLLPEIRVLLTDFDTNNLEENSIVPATSTQGTELVELLRKACFYGRDKAFAEERVTLSAITADAGVQNLSAEALEWLRQRLEQSEE